MMPQNNTILNYFSRTRKPNDPVTNGSASLQTPPTQTGKSKTNGRVNGDNSRSVQTPSSSKVNEHNTTPVTSKKRALSGDPKSNGDGSKKKPKVDNQRHGTSPSSSVSTPVPFKEGAIVWAKLEGYPWWPGMIRGVAFGGPYHKNRMTEFHVQFFDDPPSRAWLRKADLKKFGGSADGAVPPDRSDPNWVSACKQGDNALGMSVSERLDKLWIQFEPTDNDKSDTSSVEDRSIRETPKPKAPAPKRRRLLVVDDNSSDDEKKISKNKRKEKDDSDVEYIPNEKAAVTASEESSDSDSDANSIDDVDESEEDEEVPKAKAKAKVRPSQSVSSSPAPGSSRQNSKFAFTIDATPKPLAPTSTARTEKWTHLTLKFLQRDRIKDASGRVPTDPNYNPRTLHVPSEFLDKLTPAMRQWWVLKGKNFDTILFFKVGKFYEFYHMDAVTAVEELGILFMKGEYAHCGFPEISFSRFANALVDKGYKVARIEQTETPEMMAQRCKGKVSKFDKVVNREICQIATKGVRYASFQDPMDLKDPFTPESLFLYGFVESIQDGQTKFGVCFVDTTIGIFHLGQFTDDRNRSRLRTLFAHYNPVHILYETNKLNPATLQLFETLHGARKEILAPKTEFLEPTNALKLLVEGDYFRDKNSDTVVWPENLKKMLCPNDTLGLTPGENWELCLKSFGAVFWYLKHCLLEHDLLSLRQFEVYEPIDSSLTEPTDQTISSQQERKYMVLDGVTLKNLDIIQGSRSLLNMVDHCCTHFGKRRLRQYVCMPLAKPAEILKRQEAVHELVEKQQFELNCCSLLKQLPDLERLLSKVHYLGSSNRSKNHPDGRAFFFEEKKYSRHKIADLISVLKGFKTCISIFNVFKVETEPLVSSELRALTNRFPDIVDLLDTFDRSFDHKMAQKEGKIIPQPGLDSEYDDAKLEVQNVQAEADAYLKKLSAEFKTRAVYFGSDKKGFQIEVSEKVRVPNKFELSSSRKGFRRYYSEESREFLRRKLQAETTREDILRDITRRIFAQFDQNRDIWKTVVDCVGLLDVLLSLARFSRSQERMCRPEIVDSNDHFIEVEDGRHPCVDASGYIPNSFRLGEISGSESFLLLTGPNMGGKSTFMRQAGLLTILAQMGCYVPAEKCKLTVVDRVFTRLGASDNIREGESTFFVEMSETQSILAHATGRSLVLMDELGRGTATYDGTAIAFAVARNLSDRKCRCIFSTHYHTLVEKLEELRGVQLGHMACMVENENEEDPTQESITFLYKMIKGQCPKSYGFNAARLAGLTDDIVKVAYQKAKEMEAKVNNVKYFRSIIHDRNITLKDLRQLSLKCT